MWLNKGTNSDCPTIQSHWDCSDFAWKSWILTNIQSGDRKNPDFDISSDIFMQEHLDVTEYT